MHSNKVCDERDELHADYNLSRADSLRLNAENQTLADERDELKAKNRQLHRNYQNADHDYCATASQNEELHAELEALRASTIESDLTTEIEKLSAENRELSSIVTNQQRAMIDLHAEIEALKDERDGAVHTYTTVANERDTLEDECNDLAVERDELRAERVTLWNEREELKRTVALYHSVASPDYFEVVRERDNLKREVANLHSQKQIIGKARDSMFAEYEELSTQHDELRNDLQERTEYVTWLQARVKGLIEAFKEIKP
jgi:chromosome segregation ATPase